VRSKARRSETGPGPRPGRHDRLSEKADKQVKALDYGISAVQQALNKFLTNFHIYELLLVYDA
jgi:hypothetical protein